MCTSSMVGTRIIDEFEDLSVYDAVVKGFYDRIENVLNTYFTKISNPSFNLLDTKLTLSKGALKLLIEFSNKNELLMKDGFELEGVRGFTGKLPEHAIRIAGTLKLFNDPESICIDEEFMERGIKLSKYYLEELSSINDYTSMSNNIIIAGKLYKWMRGYSVKKSSPIMTLKEIYQRGSPRKEVNTRVKALKFVKILENHRLITTCGG